MRNKRRGSPTRLSLAGRTPADPPSGVRVEVKDLRKRYSTGAASVIALDGVTLSVAAGEMLAVTGPSGSGKSTLLHLIGAMDRLDEGQIRVGSVEVGELSRREQVAYRRTIGFVFQRFHLLPALTALDNVAAPLLPRHGVRDLHAQARDLLAAVGLTERSDALPFQLSGGEQQRVAIARALMNEPRLLLADEPTGNLDSAMGAEIIALLLELRKERGMTGVVGTHDPLVASRCDRIVRLRDGRVIDDLTVPPGIEPDAMLDRITRFEP